MERRAIFVDTQDALTAAISEWLHEPSLAVDTEANSFFAYRERTCLVQVSSREADWIVDPFAVDLAAMAPIFAEPRIEKVFHASEGDVLALKRDFNFAFSNLYDTLVAAKAVGRRKVGLANLLEELVGVKIAKDEQRSDWGRRPLTKEQVDYAFTDTRYLLTLSDLLKQEVAAKGEIIVEEVAVDCTRMAEREPRAREIDPEAFERHPSARKLDPVSRQILRSLYHAREQRAAELDKPVFRISNDQTLGEIAVRKPTSKAELAKIPGMTPPVISRHGDAFLAAIKEALDKGPLPFKRRPFAAPDPLEDERYERLRAWRRQVAEARDVEVEVIAGNAALKAVAKANPKSTAELALVPELDPYRRSRYAEPILRALAGPSK